MSDLLNQIKDSIKDSDFSLSDYLNLADYLANNCSAIRVIKQFDPSELKENLDFDLDAIDPSDLSIGAVIDTETTGLTSADVIIELGIVKFYFNNKSGEIYKAIGEFSGLQDPGDVPISPQASAVSGLYYDDVKGKSIDIDSLREFMQGVELVVAHKADYDRPKCEMLYPDFSKFKWACSIKNIAWDKFGISGSAKLEYIANVFGFFYSAHRAVEDCYALLKVLSHKECDDFVFKDIITAIDIPVYKVWATNAPFHVKDKLSGAGFYWSPGTEPGTEKAWACFMSKDQYDESLEWLASAIYESKPGAIVVDILTAVDRFTSRRGETSKVRLN